ncbi:hypothetical protein COL55_00855 [Bacillus toyonensis]|nr:hypothetical protein COL55_00855 [Bacillus toyonensis]PGD01487.1 hypothetical protein COM37_34010 [Bacillus toyonensis]PHA27370.1 hypothetical protein COE68_33435 [Bacillus toyonensis]
MEILDTIKRWRIFKFYNELIGAYSVCFVSALGAEVKEKKPHMNNNKEVRIKQNFFFIQFCLL